MKKFFLYSLGVVFCVCVLGGSFVVIQKRTSELWFSTAIVAMSAKHALCVNANKTDTYPTTFEMLSFQARLALKHIFTSRSPDDLTCQNVGQYRLFFRHYCEMMYLFDEVFIQKLYYFSAATQTPFIIDCGSHIGTTVLFFKCLYPQAKIIAIEPHDKSFALLTKNIEANALANVTTYKKALHDHDGTIKFYHGGGWSPTQSSVIKYKAFGQEQEVECMSLAELINEPVDFLKMDIEGAEHVVFADLEYKHKLHFIKELVLEYHHHLAASEDKLAHFLAILERNNFGYQIRQGGQSSIVDKNALQLLIIYAYQKDV